MGRCEALTLSTISTAIVEHRNSKSSWFSLYTLNWLKYLKRYNILETKHSSQ